MLTIALRILLSLTAPADASTDAIHEGAHQACELVVYAAVAPGIADDATTPMGEALAEILCRAEAFSDARDSR